MLQAQALREPNENLTVGIRKCQKEDTVLDWRVLGLGTKQWVQGHTCPWVPPLYESGVIRPVPSPHPTGNCECTHGPSSGSNVLWGVALLFPCGQFIHNKVMESLSGQRKLSTCQTDEIQDVGKGWADWLLRPVFRVTRDPGCWGGIFMRRCFSSACKLNCVPYNSYIEALTPST